MVAKAWSTQQKSTAARAPQKAVDEIFFSNDAVSVCLLMHRRAKTMRVIDFRAGPTNAKRIFVLSLAKREGVEKVYTLVERDEVATWVKLGFAKEGSIPGFYKRSDAFLLGCSVDAALRAVPLQSELRIALSDNGEHLEDVVDMAAHDVMEKTLVRAKKHAKEIAERALPAAKVVPLGEAFARRAVEKAMKAGRALTGFEPFGRDVQRRYFSITTRGGFELVASTESQACFGNAFVELLTSPKSEAERLSFVSQLRALSDKLQGEGVVSCFSLAPSDDLGMATAFVFNGFRRTGLLQNHMVIGGPAGTERKDAIIWSRKLANPADE